MKLTFGKGNAKLNKTIWTFSLPSGWTCPGANDCKSKVKLVDGKRKIKDGPNTVFRCFAASQEVLYPNVYKSRQNNLKALRHSKISMTCLINKNLPKRAKYIRIHVSGDFFSQRYFDAWINVAKQNPATLFYAYTKSLHYWTKRLGNIPDNFVLTASFGGRYDSYISSHNLRYAKVVFSEQEAKDLCLSIDKDDSHAMKNGPSFALLLHGIQPKGTEAANALVKLKKSGKGGYSAKGK